MSIFDYFSLICNDNSSIWIDQDLSLCSQKYFLQLFPHVFLLILIAYQIGQRLSISYHVWIYSVTLIRFASCLIVLDIGIFHFYIYFFQQTNTIQWIDLINTLIILVVYTFVCYLNFNKNLYHPNRPIVYAMLMTSIFLLQNYDIYRIVIGHVTIEESIYVSIRQVCLGLMSIGLLTVACHRCRQSQESQPLLTDTVVRQPTCPFQVRERSNEIINEDSATITELFTFSWLNPLMKRGYHSLINDLNDLCVLPSIILSSCSILEHHQQLYRSLFSIFGRSFCLLGVLKILGDGLAFGGPIFLNQLISYMEESRESEQQERDLRRGLSLALTLILTVSLASFLNTHFTYRINRLGLRCKMYLYTRIYTKTTQLNLSEMNQFNMGEIVNFMSTDTDRIVNIFQSFHAFWSLPVQIIIVLYLLYKQIGLTFLTGLAFAIILIPINKVIASKIGRLSTDMMLYKDERVKLISEILFGIRTIKMNTYEDYFVERMNQIRQKELKALRGRKYLDAFCVYFWATTPVLISVLTFTTYTLLGNQLTPAKVINYSRRQK